MAGEEGISIGDAVFHFVGDTQKLDEAFAKVEDRARDAQGRFTSAFDGGRAGAKSLGEELDATGDNAEYAGDKIQDAGRRSSASMRDARGEAALLGELFGIHLPRHVRSFIAELPGVGALLEGAFAATAVVFLVEALDQAVKKIEDFRKSGKEIADEWDKVGNAGRDSLNKIGDEVLSEQIKIDELNHNHLAALHDQLLLIDHASLKELGAEFDGLSTKADGVFKKMEQHWFLNWLTGHGGTLFGDDGIVKAHKDLDDFTKQYDILLSKQDQLGAASLLASSIDREKTKVAELADEYYKADLKRQNEIKAEIAGENQKLAVLLEQQRIEQDEGHKRSLQDENASRGENAKAAAEKATAAKQNLDSILAALQADVAMAGEWYQKGEITTSRWVNIQVAGMQRAYKAHEDYFAHVSELFKDDPLKEAAIAAQKYQFEQTTLAKTTNDVVAETKKLNEEFRKMAEEQAKRNFTEQEKDLKSVGKAAEDSAKSLYDLANASEVLNNAKGQGDFAAREAKIKELADFGIITERQKAAQLTALYKQEENEALKDQHEAAVKEETQLIDAQNRLLAAQKSGDIRQINEAKSAQNEIVAAHKLTDAQIALIQKKYQDRTEKLNHDLAKSYQGFFLTLHNAGMQGFKPVEDGLETLKTMGEKTFNDFAAAGEHAFAAIVLGQGSIGQALEKATAETLANLAAQAAVYAIYDTAMGIAELALGVTSSSAAEWFTAAGLMAGVAGTAGIAGAALSGASGGSGSGSSSSVGPGSQRGQGDSAGTISQPGQQPGRNTTVQPYAGGLISPQTLAMLGSSSPSSSLQSTTPIDHPDNVAAMARAMKSSGYLPEPAETGNQIHVHVKGMISPDNLTKVVRDINRKVKNNNLTLHASNSYRVTRRSP